LQGCVKEKRGENAREYRLGTPKKAPPRRGF